MVTKELIKNLRKDKRTYLRIGYKGFTIETYESYGSMDRSIYEFSQDDLNGDEFIGIICPKALSYLLRSGDVIRVKMYQNSYGQDSSLFKAGFNYRMVFLRIYRKDTFIYETLVSTEVKEIR